MFVVGNFLQAIAFIVDRLLWLYSMVVLVSVLLSWVNPDPYNPIVRFLRSATEPVFQWIRSHVPFATIGMIDISPILVFLGIWFLRMFVVGTIIDVATRLR